MRVEQYRNTSVFFLVVAVVVRQEVNNIHSGVRTHFDLGLLFSSIDEKKKKRGSVSAPHCQQQQIRTVNIFLLTTPVQLFLSRSRSLLLFGEIELPFLYINTLYTNQSKIRTNEES